MREKESKRALSFPPTAYPPPLLDGAGERKEREGERGGGEEGKKERTKGRNGKSERSATQAAKELSAILFYLSRLPLDRVHRFLTLSCFLRYSNALAACVPHHVGKGRKLRAKERKVA